jgi:UDPglucose 6-dehydrogenase
MANIVVVGAGVVGQATGKGLAKKGHAITFVDICPQKLAQLQQLGMRATVIQEVNWEVVDIVLLTVSTPTEGERIILDHLKWAAHDVGVGLRTTNHYICVVVRSTVPPTTTEDEIKPLLEAASGKRVGIDFGLAFNPEFLRQRSSEQDFDHPWITVLGVADGRTQMILQKLYAPFGGLMVCCQPTEAEMIKYVNNIFNAIKISYFNEVHQICEQLNIDSGLVGSVVARSAEGMWNPLYGIRGGLPYGGACLPKDTVAFSSFCSDRGITHAMLTAAIQVNKQLQFALPTEAQPDDIGFLSSIAHTNGKQVNNMLT